MEFTFAIIFIAVSIVIILVDLYFAARSYRERTSSGKYLGRAATLAVLVTISYLASILLTNYRAASFMCSVYFVCIDWMLIALLRFVIILSVRTPREKDRPLMWILRFGALIDSIILLINPFREIAIHYISVQAIIGHYQYEKHLLYNLHLGFTYLLVLGVLGILIRKTVLTPHRYRNQFVLITASILLVVAVNAVFIIPEKTSLYTMLDYSILGYSVALLLLYWSCFSYSQTFLLEGLSKTVFDNVNQGIILFDYMDFMVMYNRRLKEILPQIELVRSMPMREFLDQCRIPADRIADRSSYSIQSFSQRQDLLLPVRCEYKKLLDEDSRIIGHLFVFSDDSDEIDLLTGFRSWDHFRKLLQNDGEAFRAPYAAAMFDINGLNNINRRLGKEIGDHRIHELAEKIRAAMPPEAQLIRGFDANLIAVCPGMTEEDLRPYASQVIEECSGRVQMGLAEPRDEFESILKVLRQAQRSMNIRKLLDPESARSQALTSLVRALKESDSDTEAHVERTEIMGYELGRRLGLSDLELSQLRLLCLLHDIGKIGIPLEILNKPGKLTNEEWAVMQTHVEKGYQIAISSRDLRDIAEMIRAHHERWDGHGYFHRLKEEEIPILSRIISVVDSYDAMVNDRIYRPAMPAEEAQAEIRRCAGSQFDPRIAEEFLKMLEDHPQFIPAPAPEAGPGKAAMAGAGPADGTAADGSAAGGAAADGTAAGGAAADGSAAGEAAADGTAAGGAAADGTAAGGAAAEGTAAGGAAAEGTAVSGAAADGTDADRNAAHGSLVPPQPEPIAEKPARSFAVKYSRYMLDVNDRIIEVDKYFQELTGYTQSDVRERDLKQSDLIDENDRLDYFMNVDQQTAHGDIIYIEHDIVRKDGTIVHVYCCGRRFFDAAAKSIRSEIIIVDAAGTHHGKVKQ